MDLGARMGDTANDFTIVLNKVIRDNRLDASGLGLLCYLQHLPETWVVVPSQLAERFGCSRNKIVRLLTTLAELGYVDCEQPRKKDGSFSKRVWKVSKTGVPDNPDAVKRTLLSTNNLQKTNQNKEESLTWREKFYEQCPTFCSQPFWNRWIDYKAERNKNRPFKQRTVTQSKNQLESLHRHGYSADAVIEVTINRNWVGIGDHTYKTYNQCKRDVAAELII